MKNKDIKTVELSSNSGKFFYDYFVEILNAKSSKIEKIRSLISLKNTINFELINNEIIVANNYIKTIEDTQTYSQKITLSESIKEALDNAKIPTVFCSDERIDYIELIEQIEYSIVELTLDEKLTFKNISTHRNDEITAAQINVLTKVFFEIGIIPSIENKSNLSLPLASIFNISSSNIRGALSKDLKDCRDEDIKTAIKHLEKAITILKTK